MHRPLTEGSAESEDPDPLAHLTGQGELANRVRARRMANRAAPAGSRSNLVRTGLGEKIGQPAPDEKPGLGGETYTVHSCRIPGPREGAEVHARGDVLKGGKDEGIVVPAVSVVASEGALAAVRMIVLCFPVAVVEYEQ